MAVDHDMKCMGLHHCKNKCQFTFGSLPDPCDTWFYKQISLCTYMDKTIWHALMQHLSCIWRAQPKIAGTRLEFFLGGAVIGPGWAILRRRAREREVFVSPFHTKLPECYYDHCFLCISKSLHVEIAIQLRDQLWTSQWFPGVLTPHFVLSQAKKANPF